MQVVEIKDKIIDRVQVFLGQKWCLLATYFAMCMFYELSHRNYMVADFKGRGLVFITLFSGVFAIALFLITSAFGARANRILACVITGLLTVVYFSQTLYHHIFYTYFSTFSLLNGGTALQFWREIVFTAGRYWWQLVPTVVPFLLMIFLGRKLLNFERVSLKKAGFFGGAMVALHVATLLILPAFGKEEFSPWDLYYKSISPDYSVDDLGLMTTMRIDAQRLILGKQVGAVVDIDPLPEPPPAEVPEVPGVPEPVAPVVFEPNAIEIDFNALINGESDETIKGMHTYFNAIEPSLKNEKTGIYKGKNLIWITAEGFSQYAIDPKLTPTLYKMANEGYKFTNFYTPIWGVSTSDGEYVGMAGLLPKPGVWSYYLSAENYMPFSMANQLKKEGYPCRAYHNHSYKYYNRNLSHPNMGYEYKGVGGGLEMEDLWPRSDEEMVDITTNEFTADKPFHTYYMTVSGHLQYNFGGNAMAARHEAATTDLPYSEACRAYLACNIELENAMKLLLERLEKAGQLENTVILLSADHYPYGLTPEEISELAGHTIDEDFEMYESACILYQAGQQGETVDTPMCSLDLLPTMSNLFGLRFDSRLMMGRDVFSQKEPLVIFANRSFITDKGKYNTKTATFEPNPGQQVTEEYVEYFKEVVSAKFAYSAHVLENNYFEVLRQYIDK